MTPSRKARFGAGLTALAVLAGLAWLVVLAVVTPVVLGWKSAVITSGSMQPALHRGDVVLAERYDGRLLGAGTVVIFDDAERGLITHRIRVALDDGTYATKGDANQSADPRPLTGDRIVATGRAVVPRIGMLTVLAQEGNVGGLAAVAAAVAGFVWLARWGLAVRPRRGTAPPTPIVSGAVQRQHLAPKRTRDVKKVIGAVLALQLAGALAALPGARAAWFAPTGNGVSSMSSAPTWTSWYLNASAEGSNSASSAYLRLGTSSSSYSGAVPNYDTDRNADPGLTLEPTTLGLAETDLTKTQLWSVPGTPGAQNISGSMRLTLPTALANFATTGSGKMIAGLYVCDDPPSFGSCTLEDSATVDRPSGWSNGLNTFVSTVFDFGAVSMHIPGNKSLAVKVVVDSAGSAGSMWVAFDTTQYSASLVLS
jgi:signal peptidase